MPVALCLDRDRNHSCRYHAERILLTAFRGDPLRIAYFVHDLTDPAVARRIRMLQAGGADIGLLGFRRGETLARIEGVEPVDLGRTYDSRLIQRALKVVGR